MSFIANVENNYSDPDNLTCDVLRKLLMTLEHKKLSTSDFDLVRQHFYRESI